MDRAELTNRITRAVDRLTGQMEQAARYILENPGDVALLSMREQARRAGVQPWTMSRLVKRLGLSGYEELRQLHGEALKQQALGFSGRANRQVARQKKTGSLAFASEIASATALQISAMAETGQLEVIVETARAMAAARRIYCFGLRSSRPVAAHFSYMLSFLGEKALLAEGCDGGGFDALRSATAQDVFFVTTVAPYTRASVEAARHAQSLGLTVAALTDSDASPVAGLARHTMLISTESPSFFHSMTPAFMAAEILAALVAGESGEAAIAAIGRTERQLAELNVHILQHAKRRRESR